MGSYLADCPGRLRDHTPFGTHFIGRRDQLPQGSEPIGPSRSDEQSAIHLACYRRSITTQRRLTEVAVALAKFKKVHGKYPATLADLIPADLKSAPKDAFRSAPFQYAVTTDGMGCQVKSVGLPKGIGGLALHRETAANTSIKGGNWTKAAKHP